MTSETLGLTAADVLSLKEDPSPTNRALTGLKVASAFGDKLADEERAIAEEIFRLMLRDAETRVRLALSESLKDNPNIPRDIALGLARDVAEVASPILQHSEILTDEDLMEIINECSTAHSIAVAGRKHVSENVSEALADTADEDVVATLVANQGAELSEQVLRKVVDAFGDVESVNAPLAERDWLPISISERLVSLVSERLREHLVTHHELPDGLASDLVLESRERATMSLLDNDTKTVDVVTLVNQLAKNNRLTPTIILHAICMGDLVFFEAALAKLCGIPLTNAYSLISDSGGDGLRSVCRAAGISADTYRIVRVAVEVAHETEYDGQSGGRDRFVKRMIERVLTACEEGFESQDFEYLLSKLVSGEVEKSSASAA
jgi:uncharacterized protein (DUF2336 family)